MIKALMIYSMTVCECCTLTNNTLSNQYPHISYISNIQISFLYRPASLLVYLIQIRLKRVFYSCIIFVFTFIFHDPMFTTIHAALHLEILSFPSLFFIERLVTEIGVLSHMVPEMYHRQFVLAPMCSNFQ